MKLRMDANGRGLGKFSELTHYPASGEKSTSSVDSNRSSAGAPKTAREARALPIKERLDDLKIPALAFTVSRAAMFKTLPKFTLPAGAGMRILRPSRKGAPA